MVGNEYCGKGITAAAAKDHARKVWDRSRWMRGKPGEAAVRAYRRQIECAKGQGHRAAIRAFWERNRRLYGKYRKLMQFRKKYTPFYSPSTGKYYALPEYIVHCESGFIPTHGSGLYGILYGPYGSTWEDEGGLRFAPIPGMATEKEQAIIATQLLRKYGYQPWSCAY